MIGNAFTGIRENRLIVAVGVVSLLVPAIVQSDYYMQVVTMCCLFAIGALSLNLILGYTGQASLAHGGFFAIGAYCVAILTHTAGWNFWAALPAAAALAAAVGLVVGLPALRTRGAYFAIATLCLGEIIHIVAGNWVALTGGHNGIVGVPAPSPIPVPLIGSIAFESDVARYYLVLGFLAATLLVLHRLVKSVLGLTFMAVRNNEELAEALGINTFRTKLLSFVVANFLAGMAGGLYAALIGSISPAVASIMVTFNFLLYVLLGGIATLAGPVTGAFGVPILMEYLQVLQHFQMILYGVLLIVVIVYFPLGLMGGIRKLREKYNRSKAASAQ